MATKKIGVKAKAKAKPAKKVGTKKTAAKSAKGARGKKAAASGG